ncbi:MAG TPA: TetR/AcrR family transcriptional regulator [Actinocrinis sp.]|nr:TetR/AcrR family transcriptional regulator [Actinocrinis sp.]
MARTAARDEVAEPVTERLIAAATRLFAEHGYESTSVQDVVSAAGVTKGAMYHYFDSKDALLYEIYHRLLAMQAGQLEQIAAGPGAPGLRLRLAAVDVVETTAANLDEAIVFFRSQHLLAADKQKLVRIERRRYHERFRDLVTEGQQSGEFRAEVDPDLVVSYFFGSVHHLGTWFHPDGPLTATAVGESYADLLLSSLAPRG